MSYIGQFLGATAIGAFFTGSVLLGSVLPGSAAAQEFGAPPANLTAPRQVVVHRARVGWIIHRNVVPVASKLSAAPVQAEEPESASITTISAEGEPPITTRP